MNRRAILLGILFALVVIGINISNYLIEIMINISKIMMFGVAGGLFFGLLAKDMEKIAPAEQRALNGYAWWRK